MAVLGSPTERRVCTTDIRSCTKNIRTQGRSSCWIPASVMLTEIRLGQLRPDMIVYNALVAACSPGAQWACALALQADLWERGLRPQTLVCNSAISVCAKADLPWVLATAALGQARLGGCEPTVVTCSAVISAVGVGQWSLAPMLLGELQTRGLEPQGNIVTYGAVITACEKGLRWPLALRALHDLPTLGLQANLVSYGALMAACSASRQWVLALRLGREVGLGGMELNAIAASAAVSACQRAGRWELARHLLGAAVARSGVRPDVVFYNSVASAAGRPTAGC